MNVRRFGASLVAVIALAAVLVGSALAPPRTASAQTLHPVCLVGTWDSLDIETYVRSAIGSGTSSLTIDGVTGTMQFIFRESGSMEQIINNVAISGQARGDSIVVTIDATYGMDFREDSSGLVSTQPPLYGSGSARMSINGEPFLDNIDVGPFIGYQPEFGLSFRYDCTGDQLLFYPQFPDRTTAPIVLQRQR